MNDVWMVIPMNHGDLLGKENLTSVEVSMFLENVNLGNNLLDEKKKRKNGKSVFILSTFRFTEPFSDSSFIFHFLK